MLIDIKTIKKRNSMKKITITLCTLATLGFGINIHAMEHETAPVRTTETSYNPKRNAPTDAQIASEHNSTTAIKSQTHYDQLTDESQTNALRNGQMKLENDRLNKNGEFTMPDAQGNNIALDSNQHADEINTALVNKYTKILNDGTLSPAELLKNRIAFEKLTGKAYDGQNKIGETSSALNSEPQESEVLNEFQEQESDRMNNRFDSTDSLETVRLSSIDENTMEGIAKNITNESSFIKYVTDWVQNLFGKNSSNPEVQQAQEMAIEQGKSKPWYNPWDESTFHDWYTNTMDTFIQLKKSLTPSLFASKKIDTNPIFKNSQGNDIFASVDVNDVNQE